MKRHQSHTNHASHITNHASRITHHCLYVPASLIKPPLKLIVEVTIGPRGKRQIMFFRRANVSTLLLKPGSVNYRPQIIKPVAKLHDWSARVPSLFDSSEILAKAHLLEFRKQPHDLRNLVIKPLADVLARDSAVLDHVMQQC